MGDDYLEVHYEDVVQNPREALGRIGTFIGQYLDYDRIQQVALGSLQNPNSSFRGDGQEAEAKTARCSKRPAMRSILRPGICIRRFLCAS